jgi:DNA-damage-inducible protein J
MAQTNINIRMDEDLKKQFDSFCSDIGMNMTTAFCVFAKTVVREQKIPFEIKSSKNYDEYFNSCRKEE